MKNILINGINDFSDYLDFLAYLQYMSEKDNTKSKPYKSEEKKIEKDDDSALLAYLQYMCEKKDTKSKSDNSEETEIEKDSDCSFCQSRAEYDNVVRYSSGDTKLERTPVYNIYEFKTDKEHYFLFELEIPGINKDNIKISVEDNTHINIDCTEEPIYSACLCKYLEDSIINRDKGNMLLSVTPPIACDFDAIEASTATNGLLLIKIPVATISSKPKKYIDIH